jgi:undecaprenyl-diphosphatase
MHHQSQWLLCQGIRRVWNRFLEAWRSLDVTTWKRWLYTLTIGWIASGLLAFLLALLGQQLSTAGFFDQEPALLRWLTDTSPLSFETAMYLGVVGDSLFLFTLVPAAALLAVWLGQPLRALSILASLMMTDVVVFVSWQTWNRARPDILYEGLAAPGLHSFPSGHTVQAIVVYGLLAYFWISAAQHWGERGLALLMYFVIVINVIVTRLELGTHWPSDIVAAFPLGIIWLFTLILALRQASQHEANH